MFGLFKRKATQAASAAATNMRKLENKDLVEAAIGGMVLIAYCDGSCSDEELAQLQKVAEASPAFAGFASDIPAMVDRYNQQFKVSFQMGRMAVMREMKDIVADTAAKEDTLIAMSAVALSDGECSDKERAVILEVGKSLGLTQSDLDRILV